LNFLSFDRCLECRNAITYGFDRGSWIGIPGPQSEYVIGGLRPVKTIIRLRNQFFQNPTFITCLLTIDDRKLLSSYACVGSNQGPRQVGIVQLSFHLHHAAADGPNCHLPVKPAEGVYPIMEAFSAHQIDFVDDEPANKHAACDCLGYFCGRLVSKYRLSGA